MQTYGVDYRKAQLMLEEDIEAFECFFGTRQADNIGGESGLSL